jgi:hypothetical protein
VGTESTEWDSQCVKEKETHSARKTAKEGWRGEVGREEGLPVPLLHSRPKGWSNGGRVLGGRVRRTT